METSLLTTKLNIPLARPGYVPRPRLLERLHESFGYSLVLVSAPAGFGKTTLLSEWVRHANIKAAWVLLDEGDNDPVRFWDYFITALQTLQPGWGEKILPLLHSSQPPSIEPILTALINDLSGITGDFMVVLDDYHLIESQQIHDGITYLLEHLPSQMHLVIASRADPPLPLAHFRGKGMMLEIRTDDLRFTLDDAASLFKELKTPTLAIEDIITLNDHTEGWVVGLKMAALSMRGQKDIPGFIASFTGNQRYVMDYLMEEVLQKQTQEVRDFLLKTSVLERLSGPLCDAVTGRKDGKDILLNLEHAHLFIVPLDESRRWYRYEHLFTDLLKHQCETVYGKEKVSELHRQASQWYEDNSLPDEAIHHALEAKDWQRAMRLIYARCEILRKRAEFNTLLGWLKTIPDELLRTYYRLYSQYASFLTVVSEFDTAEAALSYLESAAPDDADLQGEVAFALSNIARLRGDSTRMLEMAEKALSLLPPDNTAMRSRVAYQIGSALYFDGHFREAEPWLTQACEMGQQAGDYVVVINALCFLGYITHFRGKLHRAIEIMEKPMEVNGKTIKSPGLLVGLCKIRYELNEMEAAAEDAKLAIELGELAPIAESRLIAYFLQARILLSWGDKTSAIAAMKKMDEASRHPTVSAYYRARHLACRVIFAIRQNDLEAAASWGKRLSEYKDILHLEWQHVPARLLIAQGKKEVAAEYLQELYERMVQASAHGLAIGVRVYQALAAENEESALQFLADALKMAEPEGFIRTFVDEGELLKPLLEKALPMGVTPEYTRKLLTIIEAKERQKLKMKKGEGVPSPHHAILSERELEVLRLMASGLSNQQIADRLIISLSTAKNHVHNILEKLNVQGRTQAVVQARELGLI